MSKIHEVDKNFYVESKLNLKDVEYYNVKEKSMVFIWTFN